MRRWRLYRYTFLCAGIYNITWGAYSILHPQWLFQLARLPLQNYPEIFSCLGMVVGLYGLLYLEVARHPETGWLIVAVGLFGKLLGPLGLIWLILTGRYGLSFVEVLSVK